MKIFKAILYLEDNPLKIKNFRLFIIGHFLSFTGSWIQNAAQIWLVYELTWSPLYLGIFSFFSSFPTIILTFISGVLIDLFDRRKMLSMIAFFSIFPPMILGVLTQFKFVTFWQVTFLAFLSGCLSALDTPLRQVFISEIVPMKFLTKAISFQSLSFNTARILGPFFAGLIISYGNLYQCFYINAISFIPFFIFLTFFIETQKQKEVKRVGREEIRGSYKEVYEFLKRDKKILNIIFSTANFTVFGASAMVLLPIIVHQIHGKGGKEFAFLSSILGLGAIFGASSVIFRKPIKNEIKHLFKFTIILSLGLLGLNLVKNWYATLFFCFLIGFSFTNFFPVANSYLQENTPDHLRGRIISLFTFSFLGMHPVGSFLAGFLANKISLFATLLLYTVFLFSLNTYLLVFKFKLSKTSNYKLFNFLLICSIDIYNVEVFILWK